MSNVVNFNRAVRESTGTLTFGEVSGTMLVVAILLVIYTVVFNWMFLVDSNNQTISETKKVIAEATLLCEKHGGPSVFDYNGNYECKNGTEITIDHSIPDYEYKYKAVGKTER